MLPSHLTLHEQLALLNIDANKHQPICKHYEANYLYALGGLIIIDMLLNNHIKWQDKDNLIACPENPPQNALLLQVWELCSIPNKINWFWWAGKRQTTANSLKDWVKVAAMKVDDLPQKIEQQLVNKQVLQFQKQNIMGIFPHTYRVLVDAKGQIGYKNYLKQVVKINLTNCSAHDYILLKVIKNCAIANVVTIGEPKKNHKLFLEKLDLFTAQAIENEAIINLLIHLRQGKDLDDLAETLDVLTDIVTDIADAIGDASGADGGDSGGDGGGGD